MINSTFKNYSKHILLNHKYLNKIVIILSEEKNKLANEISNIKNLKLSTFYSKKFPDGEIYVRLKEKIDDKEIILAQTLFPPNDSIIKLLLILDELNNKEINLVIPYLAYSRQHKKFLENECISAKALSKIIQNFDVKKLITVEAHSNEISEYYKEIEFINVGGFEEIIKYFENKFDIVLLPDDEKERVEKIKKFSKIYNFDFSYFIKERDRYTGEIKTYVNEELNLKNKKILLIDDMISTGGTIINALKILKNMKVKHVYVSCVHGLFLNDCWKKIKKFKFVREIVCTNSIENKFSKISLAKTISNFL